MTSCLQVGFMISLVRWPGTFAQYFDSLKTFRLSCEITCYIQLPGHTCDHFQQTLELTFKVRLLRQNPTILAGILVQKPGFNLDLDLLHRPRNVEFQREFTAAFFTHTCGVYEFYTHGRRTAHGAVLLITTVRTYSSLAQSLVIFDALARIPRER